jgi:FkbM family methyltransferase
MKEYKYAIFADRESLYLSNALDLDEDFIGFIEGSAKCFDYLGKERASISSKEIGLAKLNYEANKNKQITYIIIYCNQIGGGNILKNKFKRFFERSKYIIVLDFFEYCIKYNIKLLYENMSDHREAILASSSKWIKFSNNLSDDFSKKSVFYYLSAYESISNSQMLHYSLPYVHESYNRYSNRFSFVPGASETFIDVGAYDGDTVVKFIESTPNGEYEKIYAFEPTPTTFQILKDKKFWIDKLEIFESAVSNFNGEISFNTDNSGMGAKIDLNNSDSVVKCIKLDDVIGRATFVKVDVEGHECEVIQGAESLIKNSKPDLVIDTYHYANDALKIYELVNSIHKYKFVGMRWAHGMMNLHSLYFSDIRQLQ